MAWLNNVRGGAKPAPHLIDWMRENWGFGVRALILVTPLIFGLTFGVGWAVTGAFTWMIPLAASLGFLLWGVWGWGSYMDVGQTENSWKDKVEIKWIDWFLLKTFGPEWVPAGETSERFDTIPSPSGEVRQYWWRRGRDAVGMMLRGLYAAPFFIVAAVLVNWWLLVLIPLFCVAFSCIYVVFFSRWWITSQQPVLPLVERLASTTAAELATGALWGIFIIVVFLV
jgi:hypothetical protein